MKREQPAPLLGREPVSEADPELTHAFHPSNPGRQLRAEQASIGRFVGHPTYGREPQVDRGRGIVSLFEVDPIAKHNGAIEREARFRTIPGDELPDGMVVGALAGGRRQAIEDGGLRLFEIRQS